MVALDSLYHDHAGITLSVPCGIHNTQSVFQWYWTVCISVALDGLYLGDVGQPVSWWHWSACILNSLWLTACILVALVSLYIKQSVAIRKQPQRFDGPVYRMLYLYRCAAV